jgi:hypothetical protein
VNNNQEKKAHLYTVRISLVTKKTEQLDESGQVVVVRILVDKVVVR